MFICKKGGHFNGKCHYLVYFHNCVCLVTQCSLTLWSQGQESIPTKNTGAGYHFLIQGLPKPRIKPASPAWQVNSLPLSHLVQFSRLVMSNSLHARPPCPSPTPGVHPNSCPLSQWCHPTISSSFIPFSSCPQSFPASGSFPMSWLFAWGGQSIGASASVFPVNTLDWFPLGLTGLISLLFKGLSRVFSSTTIWKHQFFLLVYLPPLSVFFQEPWHPG